MGDELVQEAAGLALVVAVFFGVFDLFLQVGGGFFVGFVGAVVCWMGGRGGVSVEDLQWGLGSCWWVDWLGGGGL